MLPRENLTLTEMWEYLNSGEFLILSTYVGIYTALVVFFFFSIVMLYLLITDEPPRPTLNKLWTWIICSVFAILFRVLLVRFYGADSFEIWGSLAWWNLTISGLLTLLVYLRENVVPRLKEAWSNKHWPRRIWIGNDRHKR